MPWLRVDDGFVSHRKIAALTDAEFRLWMRILCFSAANRRQRSGRISRQDRREISGFSEAKSARFQALGLLDETEVPGTVEVHDFARYNPVDKTATERKQRERERKAQVGDKPGEGEDVTRDDDRDSRRDNGRDPRARARSRTPTPKDLGPESQAAASPKSKSTTSLTKVREEDSDISNLAAAQALEAPRPSAIAAACERFSADATKVEPLAQAMTAELFDATAVTVAERCETGQVRNPAGLLVEMLRDALKAQERKRVGVIHILTPGEQVIEDAIGYAKGHHPLEVALELTERKLARLGVDETDRATLTEHAMAAYAQVAHVTPDTHPATLSDRP